MMGIEPMETVARFYKVEEAYLFRSFLESEGIAAFVFDEHVPQIHWFSTQLIGGVRVVVDAEDAARAGEFFKSYETKVNAGPQVVGDVKAWPLVLLAAFLVGVPCFLFGRKSPADRAGDRVADQDPG
jgi:hypothetical protein